MKERGREEGRKRGRERRKEVWMDVKKDVTLYSNKEFGSGWVWVTKMLKYELFLYLKQNSW